MSDADIGTVERALSAALRAGADSADALLISSDVLEARVRGDEIDFVKQAHEHTLGIRSFVAGPSGLRTACTSLSDLGEAAVARMAEECVALAQATAEDAHAGLPASSAADPALDLELLDPAEHPVSVEGRIDVARRAERAARAYDPRITNSEGSQVSSELSQLVYARTDGFLGEYRSASHSLYCEPLASQADSMQRDYWMTLGRRLEDLESPERVGERAAERAVRRLGARRVATCRVPVIFDPVTAPSLLGHLAACVNGYALYREASFLAGRLGETIASEAVHILDDGLRPGGLGSKPFDGEGLPTRRTDVVREGRLESYLLDTYSGRKLGLDSTGNAARGVGGGPSVGVTNLWLEPGESSLEEIVRETSRGLLVTELIGMGFNPVTGDYSRGACGFWIEGGERVHPVEEVTIAGHLGDMLRGIDRIGSDLIWLGRIAAPSLRIERMTVAGQS